MLPSPRYNYNSETAVTMDRTTQRHISDDRNRDALSRQDLKSHNQQAHTVRPHKIVPYLRRCLLSQFISQTSPKSQHHDENIRQTDKAIQRSTFSKVIRQQDRRRRFDSGKKQYSFLFANTSRPTLTEGSAAPEVPGGGGGCSKTYWWLFRRGYYGRAAKPTIHFQTRLRFGMCGAVPPLAYTSS
jgi:hypothetical protein